MTEEERVEQINKYASAYLKEWLDNFAEGDVTENELLARLYASMVMAYLLGYSPDVLALDAKEAVDKVLPLLGKGEE